MSTSNPGAEINHQAAQRRADSYFLVYVALGPLRSLTRLQELLAQLGLDVSLNTLKSYSSRYTWQERTTSLGEAAAGTTGTTSGADARHAALGVTLQQIAQKGLQERFSNGLLVGLSVSDLLKLLRSGVEMEREALAQPVEHRELDDAMALFEGVGAFALPEDDDEPEERPPYGVLGFGD